MTVKVVFWGVFMHAGFPVVEK